MQNFSAPNRSEGGASASSAKHVFEHMHKCDGQVLWRHRSDDLLCCRTFATGEQNGVVHDITFYAYIAAATMATAAVAILSDLKSSNVRYRSTCRHSLSFCTRSAGNNSWIIATRATSSLHRWDWCRHTIALAYLIQRCLVGKPILRFAESSVRHL